MCCSEFKSHIEMKRSHQIEGYISENLMPYGFRLRCGVKPTYGVFHLAHVKIYFP